MPSRSSRYRGHPVSPSPGSFPLLLVLVTLLCYFLPPSMQGDVLGMVAGFVPLLSTDSIGHLSGQWWTLLVGTFSALWSGSFVVTTTQSRSTRCGRFPMPSGPLSAHRSDAASSR